ncbi:hypothetical protein PybrP1_005182 [[Pythium] brassicae (nom. inval.)]|nr:hypothetical protein PybrP1_005182 [[Pythium] brassicae (nom. inval.)]
MNRKTASEIRRAGGTLLSDDPTAHKRDRGAAWRPATSITLRLLFRFECARVCERSAAHTGLDQQLPGHSALLAPGARVRTGPAMADTATTGASPACHDHRDGAWGRHDGDMVAGALRARAAVRSDGGGGGRGRCAATAETGEEAPSRAGVADGGGRGGSRRSS